MIYLFVNLKEPFINPSKTNNQIIKVKVVLRLLEFHHLVLMMVAQIVECLVYVYCPYSYLLKSYTFLD